MKQRIHIPQSRAVLVVNAELLEQAAVEETESELVKGNRGIPSND
jgi:hypothetical protein